MMLVMADIHMIQISMEGSPPKVPVMIQMYATHRKVVKKAFKRDSYKDLADILEISKTSTKAGLLHVLNYQVCSTKLELVMTIGRAASAASLGTGAARS